MFSDKKSHTDAASADQILSPRKGGSCHWNAVYSDVDGTFLTDDGRVLPGTRAAIRELSAKGIPFTIASARSPKGIFPLLKENDIRASIIAFSGALLMDEDRHILYQKGFSWELAEELIAYTERSGIDVAWNIFTVDDWITKDRRDERIRLEEAAVKTTAREGSAAELPLNVPVLKLLLLTEDLATGDALTAMLRRDFPFLSVTKSWPNYVEVMCGGITKAAAIRRFSSLRGISPSDAVAFGDNYNDLEMLEAAGHGVIMANAPEELRRRIGCVTEDNNHEGIANELRRLGLIS